MFLDRFANNPNKGPIGIVEKFSYGLGDFASCLMYVPVTSLLVFYYTEFVGVNIASVAMIMLFSRIFDGFSDIIVGMLIEKTNSKFGKTRSWILRMIIPFFIGTVALFSVPSGLPELGKLVYIFFSYNFAITVVYTAINLPYGAMNTMMTNDSYERSIIVIYRMILATAGNILAMLSTLPLVRILGNDQMAWTLAFVIIGGFASLCFFITFANCHERIVSAEKKPQEKKESMGKSFKLLVTNKYWLMLTIAMLAFFSSDVVFGTANTYFCQYFLHDAEIVGTFASIFCVLKVIVLICVLPFCLKKTTKRNCLYMGFILVIASAVLRLMSPYDLALNYVVAALFGAGMGFTYACAFAMIPDTVEYGEYKDHERHEGLIYAGASFGTKVAAGLGAVIASFILDFGGYVNKATEQTPDAMASILYATTLAPIVLYTIAFVALLPYKLDKEYSGILKVLGERKAQKAYWYDDPKKQEELNV